MGKKKILEKLNNAILAYHAEKSHVQTVMFDTWVINLDNCYRFALISGRKQKQTYRLKLDCVLTKQTGNSRDILLKQFRVSLIRTVKNVGISLLYNENELNEAIRKYNYLCFVNLNSIDFNQLMK